MLCGRFAFDDNTNVIPKWKNHTLDEVIGWQVRIAVELNGATLHAMTLAARPYIAEPQASFADPTQLK